ncbi:MAG: DUF1995 family protein [Prochlorotrichaceae cyanobacterium]|jgi:hypothetical protein
MNTLPSNLDETIAQAREATQAALEAGYTRLQVEILIPELKIQPIIQQFIQPFTSMGSELRLFFPDPGAAALARRDWGETPYAVRGIGEMKAVILPEESLFIFVEPSSVEVAEVEKLCEAAGDRPVVFLNPCLEDVATVGIGYAGRQLRDRFLSKIESCYYMKPLEDAALFRCYPQPWQVWESSPEDDAPYVLKAEVPEKPVGEALDRLLYGDEQATSEASSSTTTARKQPGLLADLQRFFRALSQ